MLLSKAEKRRHYRRLRVKVYLLAGAAGLLLVLLFYGALNLPALKIKKIETVGIAKLEDVRPAVLRSIAARLLGLDNFLAWPGKVGAVEVEKDYSTGVLRLKLPSPERFAIWCSKNCFWVGADGVVIEEAPDTEGSSINKIRDDRDFTPVVGKSVVPSDLAVNIVKIIQGLSGLPIRIKDYSFDDRLQELRANGVKGETIIFSARLEPTATLLVSLRDLIESGRVRTAEYIDLTVENRIYIKQFINK